MRWNGLFADLEAQMGRELEVEEAGVAADEFRWERSRQHLPARIADLGAEGVVRIRLTDGASVRLRVQAVGVDWIAGRDADSRRLLLIPVTAVVTAARGGDGIAVPQAGPGDPDRTRLGIQVVLRDLARRRVAVTVSTSAGRRHGTMDAVGSDHIELAVHAEDAARRQGDVAAVELVALAAVLALSY
ncbi:MAG: hypothetical protein ABWZ77_06285 [Naasia sp.]